MSEKIWWRQGLHASPEALSDGDEARLSKSKSRNFPAMREVLQIYVIGPEGGPLKIGVASDVEARRSALQTANALPLVVHHRVGVPRGLAKVAEALAHKALAEARMMGEWFDASLGCCVAAVEAAIVDAPRVVASTARVVERADRSAPDVAQLRAAVVAAATTERDWQAPWFAALFGDGDAHS